MCKWLVGNKVETQNCNNSYLGTERFFFFCNRKDLSKKQFCKGIYQIILWKQNLNGSQAKFPSQDPYKIRLISHRPWQYPFISSSQIRSLMGKWTLLRPGAHARTRVHIRLYPCTNVAMCVNDSQKQVLAFSINVFSQNWRRSKPDVSSLSPTRNSNNAIKIENWSYLEWLQKGISLGSLHCMDAQWLYFQAEE